MDASKQELYAEIVELREQLKSTTAQADELFIRADLAETQLKDARARIYELENSLQAEKDNCLRQQRELNRVKAGVA